MEFQTEIDDGNDFAAKIDDAFDMRGCLRNRCNFLQSHDFPDFQDTNSEFLVGQLKRQILPWPRVTRRGRSWSGCDRRWHTALLGNGFHTSSAQVCTPAIFRW